nr:acetyl-CoA carboxylase carboxyltransferase beta subunit [Haplothismia exannulata]
MHKIRGWYFNVVLPDDRFEPTKYKYGLIKLTGSPHVIGHNSGEDKISGGTNDKKTTGGTKDKNKNKNGDSTSYIFYSDGTNYHFFIGDYLLGIENSPGLVRDDAFFWGGLGCSNGGNYFVYLNSEDTIFGIHDTTGICFSMSKNLILFLYDTRLNYRIRNCIDSYLRLSIICINSLISGDAGNYNDHYISLFIQTKNENYNITMPRRSTDFSHLWVQCEYCYGLNYKKFFKSKMYICEQCGYHLKMSSSDRIELCIDPGTWEPMYEDLLYIDPIDEEPPGEEGEGEGWEEPSEERSNSEEREPCGEEPYEEYHPPSEVEEPYIDRIDSYQIKTGLTEAVQTGIGNLKGIPVGIGIMDFQFMGGSMGSVVGERITRLIEYATTKFSPIIIVCASGGARMQEGSFSLMQMAKIASALYNYQVNERLFYISILTSPTTGGVTASFGMLGNIIITEPNAYIAFAGKRVIELTLNKEVPEGSQEAEYLFDKGLFDSIVPRNFLKSVLSELLQLHGFFPRN